MWALLPEADLTVPSYCEWVDGLVRSRLNEHGRRWEELVRSLPGVDPTTVFDSIRRQKLSARVDFNKKGDVVLQNVASELPRRAYDLNDLPTPHPLDYCWWFDSRTVSNLVASVRDLSLPSANVVLLGTPTVFDAVTSIFDTRSFVLVDSDPLVVSRRTYGASHKSHAVLADLTCTDVNVGHGQVVIADPPWYEAESRAFLWAARQACELNGVVLVSFPPEGTRPGVVAESERALNWAKTLGLEVEECNRGVLSYVSPLFEENALNAASVPPLHAAWRRGDLVRLRCAGVCRTERPSTRIPSGHRWTERLFGDVRIRVRQTGDGSGWRDPALYRITESDLLPTVSRRDHRRDLVDVWTSGNRVFRCNGKQILLYILDAIAYDDRTVRSVEHALGRHLTADEEEQVRQTEDRLRQIIQAEGTEVSSWRERHARVDIVTS